MEYNDDTEAPLTEEEKHELEKRAVDKSSTTYGKTIPFIGFALGFLIGFIISKSVSLGDSYPVFAAAFIGESVGEVFSQVKQGILEKSPEKIFLFLLKNGFFRIAVFILAADLLVSLL